MIAIVAVPQESASLDASFELAADELCTAAGLRVVFPAGVYRPVYRTKNGTVFRGEHPVLVNDLRWEHAGLLITNEGGQAFQFNENQSVVEVLDHRLPQS